MLRVRPTNTFLSMARAKRMGHRNGPTIRQLLLSRKLEPTYISYMPAGPTRCDGGKADVPGGVKPDAVWRHNNTASESAGCILKHNSAHRFLPIGTTSAGRGLAFAYDHVVQRGSAALRFERMAQPRFTPPIAMFATPRHAKGQYEGVTKLCSTVCIQNRAGTSLLHPNTQRRDCEKKNFCC